MKLELTFVLLLVAAAIAYAAWRVIQAVKAAGDPCRGCAGCALKDARKRNSSKKLKLSR